MSKQALPEELAKRLNAFSIDPADCVIIGHDTADGPEHVLYDERANAPVDEETIKGIVGALKK